MVVLIAVVIYLNFIPFHSEIVIVFICKSHSKMQKTQNSTIP